MMAHRKQCIPTRVDRPRGTGLSHLANPLEEQPNKGVNRGDWSGTVVGREGAEEQEQQESSSYFDGSAVNYQGYSMPNGN